MANSRTRQIVDTSLMLSLAVVLSFIHLPSMPYGGSVTLCSSLPIILIAYRYGVRWGMFTGSIYAVLSILLKTDGLRGYTPVILIGMLLFDYFLACSILGLGGLFRHRVQRPSSGLLMGTVAALTARYAVHVISGFLFFWQFAEEVLALDGFPFGQAVLQNTSGRTMYLLYSLIYNATFMIPEIILTAAAAFLVGMVPIAAKTYHVSKGGTKA